MPGMFGGFLKQSTAVTVLIGPFVDETDGYSDEGGLTISQADVRLSKNGANMAQKNDATACTHDELGMYTCPLDTTDTDTLGILQLIVHESGARTVAMWFMVQPANVWDSLYGADALQVDAVEISGDSGAADNLELDYDGTGYAKANSTIGTLTTYTGNTPQTGDSFARLGAPVAASISADIAVTDAVADAIKVVTDALTAAAATNLALSGGQIIPFTVDDTAFAPTSTDFEADDITEATSDHYNGRYIVWTTGVLAGQQTDITDYSLQGGRGRFTVTSMTEPPGNNDTGIIV